MNTTTASKQHRRCACVESCLETKWGIEPSRTVGSGGNLTKCVVAVLMSQRFDKLVDSFVDYGDSPYSASGRDDSREPYARARNTWRALRLQGVLPHESVLKVCDATGCLEESGLLRAGPLRTPPRARRDTMHLPRSPVARLHPHARNKFGSHYVVCLGSPTGRNSRTEFRFVGRASSAVGRSAR